MKFLAIGLLLVWSGMAQALDLNVGGVHVGVGVNPPGPGGGPGTGVGVGVGVGKPGGPHVGVGVGVDIDPDLPGIQPPPPPVPPVTPPPTQPPVPFTPEQRKSIDEELNALDADDLAALKIICKKVLANPTNYSAIKLAICQLIAEK